MTVNATFAQHLHLGAKIMGSHGFEGHLQMVQMCRQICFFEVYLHITQMIAQICCFAQLLLFMYKHVNLLFSERLRSFANVSEVCNLNNVGLGYHG